MNKLAKLLGRNQETPIESERDAFAENVIDKLDSIDPAVCINGDTSDFMNAESKTDIIHSLLEVAVQPEDIEDKKYDFVLLYNPARKRIEFGDEQLGMDEDDCYMEEEFKKAEIFINSGAHDQPDNAVDKMIKKDVVTSSHQLPTDRVFLETCEALIKKGKKICIILDEANAFFPQNNQGTSSMERYDNEILTIDVIRGLHAQEDTHLITIDRKNTVNGRMSEVMEFKSIPPTNEADVLPILNQVKGLKDKKGAAVRAIRTRMRDLLKLVKNEGDNPDSFVKSLIKFKEDQITRMAGGTVKCRIETFTADQIALHKGEIEYWEDIRDSLISNPDVVPQGALLAGPPGTGKTVRGRYLASLLKVPFLEMDNIGSVGLRGVKEDKIRKVIKAAIANKPCVLFIDEFDKVLPSKTRDGMNVSSNDDSEVAGYLQNMLGSPEMEGVFVIGGTNYLKDINTAVTRNGRMGAIVAVLPPDSIEEKIEVFQAVFNQIPSAKNLKVKPRTIRLIVESSKDAVGSDYKELIKRSILAFGKGRFKKLDEALIFYNKSFNYKKRDEFFDMIDKAKEDRSVDFEINAQETFSEKETAFLAELSILDEAKQIARDAAEMVASEREAIHGEYVGLDAAGQKLAQAIDKAKEAFKLHDGDIELAFENLQEQMIAFKEEQDKAHQLLADRNQEVNGKLESYEELVRRKVKETLVQERADLAELRGSYEAFKTTLDERELDLAGISDVQNEREIQLNEFQATIDTSLGELEELERRLSEFKALIDEMTKGNLGEIEKQRFEAIQEQLAKEETKLKEQRERIRLEQQTLDNEKKREAGKVTDPDKVDEYYRGIFYTECMDFLKTVFEHAQTWKTQDPEIIITNLNEAYLNKQQHYSMHERKASLTISKFYVTKDSDNNLTIKADFELGISQFIDKTLHTYYKSNLIQFKDPSTIMFTDCELNEEWIRGEGEVANLLYKLGIYAESMEGHSKESAEHISALPNNTRGDKVNIDSSFFKADSNDALYMATRILKNELKHLDKRGIINSATSLSINLNPKTLENTESLLEIYLTIYEVLTKNVDAVNELIASLGPDEAKKHFDKVSSLEEFNEFLKSIDHINNHYLNLRDVSHLNIDDYYSEIAKYGNGHNSNFNDKCMSKKDKAIGIEENGMSSTFLTVSNHISANKKDCYAYDIGSTNITIKAADKFSPKIKNSILNDLYLQFGTKFPKAYTSQQTGCVIETRTLDTDNITFKLKVNNDWLIEIYNIDYSRCKNQSEQYKRDRLANIHKDLENVFKEELEKGVNNTK